jgi:hypothetical protein
MEVSHIEIIGTIIAKDLRQKKLQIILGQCQDIVNDVAILSPRDIISICLTEAEDYCVGETIHLKGSLIGKTEPYHIEAHEVYSMHGVVKKVVNG